MFRRVSVDDAIKMLNEALALDRAAIEGLVEGRVNCSKALAGHPTIQVQEYKPGCHAVGLLGIINGLFGIDEDGIGPIASSFEKGELARFQRSASKWFTAGERCEYTCPHGDRCTLEEGHLDGCNHKGCECNKPNYRRSSLQALVSYMSNISEEVYAAGWLHNLEFLLWHALADNEPRKNNVWKFELTPTQKSTLKNLAADCGGWVAYNDGTYTNEFVPLEEWKKRYEAWLGKPAMR